MPSSVPIGVREVWPSLTSAPGRPGLRVSGSAQPSTHLSQMPMCVGSAWKTGPVCEPEAIRSQKSTSESALPERVVEVRQAQVVAVLVGEDADAGVLRLHDVVATP